MIQLKGVRNLLSLGFLSSVCLDSSLAYAYHTVYVFANSRTNSNLPTSLSEEYYPISTKYRSGEPSSLPEFREPPF